VGPGEGIVRPALGCLSALGALRSANLMIMLASTNNLRVFKRKAGYPLLPFATCGMH